MLNKLKDILNTSTKRWIFRFKRMANEGFIRNIKYR